MREALFNLVGPVDDATVLDLYAGSGALGLEALSRGARRCVFAEADGAACAVIRSNLETLGLTGALVLQRDALAVAPRGDHRGSSLRPRPARPAVRALAGARAAARRARCRTSLADSGLVVVETDARVEPELPLDLVTTRRYGSARLSVFTHGHDRPQPDRRNQPRHLRPRHAGHVDVIRRAAAIFDRSSSASSATPTTSRRRSPSRSASRSSSTRSPTSRTSSSTSSASSSSTSPASMAPARW